MTYIILGVLLFGGFHLFSILFPGARDAVKRRLGETGWRMMFAAASLIAIGMLVIGFVLTRGIPAESDVFYEEMPEMRHLTMLLVLLGFILMASAHGKGYLRKWLHNPMSIGVALWAIGHLLVNGLRADVYLFGVFLVVAVADIALSEFRGKRPAFAPRIRSDVIAVVAGVALYLVFLYGFHPYILNVPVI